MASISMTVQLVKRRKPTEANRRSEGKRELARLEMRRGSPRTRFRRIMAYAKEMYDNDPESLHLLIAALGRVIQSQAILEPVLHTNNVDSSWMLERSLLFDDRFPLDGAGRKLDRIILQVERTRSLLLGRDIVLPWPWNAHRLKKAMQGLGPTGDWGPWRADSNHQVVLWEPIGIGWVHGGNHSISVGILLAHGTIVPQETYDMSPLYDYVTCDGNVYRRKHDRAIISEVASIEMAAIFEIGRLLAMRPALKRDTNSK